MGVWGCAVQGVGCGGVCSQLTSVLSPLESSVLGFGQPNLWKLTEPELAVTLPLLHPDRVLKPLPQDLALAAELGSAPGHLAWRPCLHTALRVQSDFLSDPQSPCLGGEQMGQQILLWASLQFWLCGPDSSSVISPHHCGPR